MAKKQKKKSSQGKGVSQKKGHFGTPIIKTNKASIPQFVFLFIQYLRQNPMQGLFRVPGSNTQIQKVKQELDNGDECLYLYRGKEYTHVVASLLKLWFRELPEPLLTFDHYDMFIAADGINEENARLQTIRKVLKFLPEANRKLLFSLCEFLHDMLQFEEITKMGAGNLAIVFAPNLLRPKTQDISIMMTDTSHATGLMQTLIEEFEFLFQDYLEEEKKERERMREQARIRMEKNLTVSEEQKNTPLPPPPTRRKPPPPPIRVSSYSESTSSRKGSPQTNPSASPSPRQHSSLPSPPSSTQHRHAVSFGSSSDDRSDSPSSLYSSRNNGSSSSLSSNTAFSPRGPPPAVPKKVRSHTVFNRLKPATPVRKSSLIMKDILNNDGTPQSAQSTPPALPPKPNKPSSPAMKMMQTAAVNSPRSAPPVVPSKPSHLRPPPPIPDRSARSSPFISRTG